MGDQVPKVSIIVRTHARPAMLRECLQSLREQAYENFEVIVVEDGPSTAAAVVESFSEALNLRYFCTGQRIGRSAAGNLGLARAAGEWLGFLDDDDQLLPAHISILVNEALRRQCQIVYGLALEVPTRIEFLSEQAFRYTEEVPFVRYRTPFKRLLLWQKNFLPIQSVLFHRSLYERHGGFDEDLDQLEDWVLWVRYSLSSPFEMIDEVTSRYRVPADSQDIEQRQAKLSLAYKAAVARQREMRVDISPPDLICMFESEFLASPLRYIAASRSRRLIYRFPFLNRVARRLIALVRHR